MNLIMMCRKCGKAAGSLSLWIWVMIWKAEFFFKFMSSNIIKHLDACVVVPDLLSITTDHMFHTRNYNNVCTYFSHIQLTKKINKQKNTVRWTVLNKQQGLVINILLLMSSWVWYNTLSLEVNGNGDISTDGFSCFVRKIMSSGLNLAFSQYRKPLERLSLLVAEKLDGVNEDKSKQRCSRRSGLLW